MAELVFTNIGANTCIGEVHHINAGGFLQVNIENPMILAYVAKYQPPPAEPKPGVYELTGIVTKLVNQTASDWHVSNFEWRTDINGKLVGIRFRVNNDAPAVGGHTMDVSMTAKFHQSLTR